MSAHSAHILRFPGAHKRRKKTLPQPLRWSEAMTLLSWCRAQQPRCPSKQLAARRDEIIVLCLLYLGLRIMELCRLRVEQCDLERRQVFVRLGKGSKDRYVRIPTVLMAPLKAWIGEQICGPLLGCEMSDRTIRWRLDKAAKAAGLVVHVHPHSLRHTYATHLLDTGAALRTVQAMLGHENLQSTAVYLDLDTSRFASDVDRM